MLTNNAINLLSSNINTAFTYIAIGSNNTPESESDSALYEETYRGLSTNSISSASRPNDTVVVSKRFNISGETFKEAGLFNSASTGTMFTRNVETVILTDTQFVDIVYNITFKESE